MCYYDQYRFECGDWKWGNFRQHCNREYRSGETCGMKLVMNTLPVREKCTLCDKIATKYRRREKEVERITRWQRDGGKFKASIDKSMEIIHALDKEITTLLNERARRLNNIGNH